MKVTKDKNAEECGVEAAEAKVELCAIPREFVLNKLTDLYNANKQLFDEYNLFVGVLNSQVQVTNLDSEKPSEA